MAICNLDLSLKLSAGVFFFLVSLCMLSKTKRALEKQRCKNNADSLGIPKPQTPEDGRGDSYIHFLRKIDQCVEPFHAHFKPEISLTWKKLSVRAWNKHLVTCPSVKILLRTFYITFVPFDIEESSLKTVFFKSKRRKNQATLTFGPCSFWISLLLVSFELYYIS